VHLAARILATAGPGEIVVSRTVRDLVAGSDLVLQDRGSRRLKGVEGDWQLYSLAGR
jgi:class 3 adenylate cyclase